MARLRGVDGVVPAVLADGKRGREFEMRLNYIDNIDCLEGLRSLPDESVDLVLTDPPYGIGIKSQGGAKGQPRPS